MELRPYSNQGLSVSLSSSVSAPCSHVGGSGEEIPSPSHTFDTA